MVFVARLIVDEPFHKGLLRNIQLSQTVDYDMHMDIAAAVVTVQVGADQRLMPRKVGFYIPKNERRLKSVEEHLKMLEQEEQKYQTLRRQLYEDMSSGIVSKEEYKEFSHSFNEKVEAIRKAKAEMNRQRDCLNNLDVEHLPWIEDFKSYQNLTSLNRRVLVELVESITVYDKEHIHIQYRFDQEIRNVLEYCSSVPAAETEESAV